MTHSSSFVKGKKYRNKKSLNQQLRTESNSLGQERSALYEALNKLETYAQIYWTFSQAKIKELEEQVLSFENNLREYRALVEGIGQGYWAYSQKEIKTSEERIKGLLWLTRQLNQQKKAIIQTKDNEINELYANEIVGEIEKDSLERQLNQTNQQNQAVQQQLDQTQQANQNLQIQLDTRTAEYNEAQYQRAQQEERANYFHKRYQTLQKQLNASDTTLVGDEDEVQAGPSNTKNPANQVNNPNWKSRLWNSTKKLGLTALAAYGSYQTGRYQGSNSCPTNQLSPIQPNSLSVAYNQTHSWIENPLLANAQYGLEPQLRLRPNITLDKYQELLKNKKPLDLPENWKFQLAQISELEKRPNITQEEFTHYKSPEQVQEIEKAAREEVQKEFKDFVNPNNSTDLAEHDLFTKEQHDQAIDQAVQDKDQEWTDKGLISPTNSTALSEHKLFTEDQVKKATTKAIEDNNKLWTEKGLIDPYDEEDLFLFNLVKKANLTAVEQERDNRPNITLNEWKNDYSLRPTQKLYDQEKTQHDQAKTDLSNAQAKVKQAQEFGLTNWDNLKSQIGNETLTTLLARPTQEDLENKQKKLDHSNQQITSLTTQLNKLNSDLLNVKENSQFEITRLKSENKTYQKQRDSRPDITFTDYQQLLADKNNATLTIQGLEKNLNNALAERDTALQNLETFNQQLDETNQELVRTQREKRKLAKKLQKQKSYQAKTEQKFQEQQKQQSSYLQNILQCLTSAGIAKLAWKTGRAYERGELETKYLKDIQSGINSLIQQRNEVQTELDTKTTELNQIQAQKVAYENYLQMGLKVNHLDNPPTNNSGQSLQELITYYNNHNPVSLLSSSISQVKNVIAQYRDDQSIDDSKLNVRLTNSHTITETTWGEYISNAANPTDLAHRKLKVLNALATEIIAKNNVPCSHATTESNHVCQVPSDYQQIQAERNNLEVQVQTIQQDNEKALVQELNTALQLNLKEPTRKQVINRLQELIAKPPIIQVREDQDQLNQAQQTIVELEKQNTLLQKELSEKETPFGEDLEVIKELELNSLEHLFKQKVDTDTIQQIQQATNYQQVVTTRQAFLQKHLNQQNVAQLSNLQTVQQEKKSLVKQRNLGLVAAGTILTAGLASTIYLGRKVKQLKAVNQAYYSDYQKIKGELQVLLIKMHKLVEEKRG